MNPYRGPLPTLGKPIPYINPIIQVLHGEAFDHPEWIFELKYDGFRGLCYLERGRGWFISRNGKRMTRFDEFADQLARGLAVRDAVLDGEVVASDESGRPQFYALLRRSLRPTYAIFDLLWLNSTDLRSLPLSERRRLLQAVLPQESREISEVLSVEGRGRQLFDLICAHDLEGIVAKRLGDPYGSRTRWLKIKNRDYSQAEGRADLLNKRGNQRRAAWPLALGEKRGSAF